MSSLTRWWVSFTGAYLGTQGAAPPSSVPQCHLGKMGSLYKDSLALGSYLLSSFHLLCRVQRIWGDFRYG